jgi:hypothetical protein
MVAVLMRITDFTLTKAGDYISLAQNATQDPSALTWTRNDTSRDAFLIEFLDSAADQGYIAMKRTDSGTGIITWTEIARMNYDGTLILPALSASIASAAASQLKLFAKDYLGRTALAKTDSTDEAYLLEGKGLSRVWRQSTEPAGAKLWDVWIDTSDPSTTWTDLQVPGTAGQVGTSKPPALTQFKDNGSSSIGVYLWAFGDEAVDANEEQLYFSIQLPHSYKHGTDLKAHVHWTPAVSGGANEFVKWGLEYTWANIGANFGNTTIITSDASSGATATTSGDTTLTADEHYITSIGTISGTGKTLSSMLICRLFRNSSHANDDLAQDAYLFEMDFHFEMDITGSRQEFIK